MDSLKIRLKNIEKDFNQQLASVDNFQQLTSLKTSFLGRKGHINQLFSQISPKDKAKWSKEINTLKKQIQEKIQKTETKTTKTVKI